MFDFVFVFVLFFIYPLYLCCLDKKCGQRWPTPENLVGHPGKMWALARSMAQKKTQGGGDRCSCSRRNRRRAGSSRRFRRGCIDHSSVFATPKMAYSMALSGDVSGRSNSQIIIYRSGDINNQAMQRQNTRGGVILPVRAGENGKQWHMQMSAWMHIGTCLQTTN